MLLHEDDETASVMLLNQACRIICTLLHGVSMAWTAAFPPLNQTSPAGFCKITFFAKGEMKQWLMSLTCHAGWCHPEQLLQQYLQLGYVPPKQGRQPGSCAVCCILMERSKYRDCEKGKKYLLLSNPPKAPCLNL